MPPPAPPEASTEGLTRTEEAVVRAEARDDLLFYTQFCDPSYCVGSVHRHVARVLERVARGELKRVIINLPPRHGKSRLTTVEFPTWVMGRDPRRQFILASYSANLATKHSREARLRIVERRFNFLFPGVDLFRGAMRAEAWSTTSGSHYRCAGVGGTITGHGADFLIVDDPFADHAEAHSPTIRETVWNWYLSTLYTRLAPGGAIIIIMTRWHTDDLVGRLLSPLRQEDLRGTGAIEEAWHVVKLPALAKAADPMGRPEGTALWPESYPAERLRAIQATVGHYLWASLYDQEPTQQGGNYIDSADFVVVPRDRIPEGLRWMRFWDLATSAKESADFTVGVKGAIDKAGNLWLADLWRGQWEWPRARAMIKQVAETEAILVGVESVGGFKSAFQNLREVVSGSVVLNEVGVETDKLTRALPWIALTEQRKVFLVAGNWISDFLTECRTFPSGAHDDQVDAVSGVYQMLKRPVQIFLA